ncbi:hypothetical protein D3C79_811400 [compost metagenome]
MPGTCGIVGRSLNTASISTPGILFSIPIRLLMESLKIPTMPSQADLARPVQPPIEPNQSESVCN